jgi:hypothetical protein
MSMRGSCRCKNISVSWRNRDLSLVPRACLCGYCSAKGAAYVSKSGTAVDALIRKGQFHVVREHGSRQAAFHECSYCGDVVIVTVQIEGILYCALNVLCLEDWRRFPQPVAVNFSDHTPEEKLRRWRQNWCYPVHMAGEKG